MLIVYWPITIKFRTRVEQTSKAQTNYRCYLRFSYLATYWLIFRNIFHKYLWCSRFCESHSKLHLTGLQSGARFFLANHYAAIYPIAGVNLKLT